jgi:hypothetical protein
MSESASLETERIVAPPSPSPVAAPTVAAPLAGFHAGGEFTP